jgi:hypothetical protein
MKERWNSKLNKTTYVLLGTKLEGKASLEFDIKF